MSWVVLVIPSPVVWILVVQTGLLFLCVIAYLIRHLQTLYVRAQRRRRLVQACALVLADMKRASSDTEDEELPPWDKC